MPRSAAALRIPDGLSFHSSCLNPLPITEEVHAAKIITDRNAMIQCGKSHSFSVGNVRANHSRITLQ